jgi:hypothetical protein
MSAILAMVSCGTDTQTTEETTTTDSVSIDVAEIDSVQQLLDTLESVPVEPTTEN